MSDEQAAAKKPKLDADAEGGGVLPRDDADAARCRRFLDETNLEYERLHLAFEEQFWGTKMGLKAGDFSTEALTSTKLAMESFLASPERLAETRRHLAAHGPDGDEGVRKVLKIFERSFLAYQMDSTEATALRERATALEGALAEARNKMALGYTMPGDGGAFVAASSVGLRNTMRTVADEPTRAAALEGMRAIGPFVLAHGFVEIVRARNAMARALGYCDFYDYKCTQAEGFGKARLFEILDGLEARTRPLMVAARETLAATHGADALKPHNTGYMLAGETTKVVRAHLVLVTTIAVARARRRWPSPWRRRASASRI